MVIVSPSIPPSPSSTATKKIKRKPVPSVDVDAILSSNIIERYPPPDPNDPFAPLSVLRSRSSTLSGRVETTTATYYCDVALPKLPYPSEDIWEPLKLPPKVFAHRESHYRRRSQSIGLVPSSSAPFGPASVPSLVPDTGSGNSSDIDFPEMSSCPNASTTRNKVARIFLANKASSTSVASSVDSTRRRRKVSIASVSYPLPSPPRDRTVSAKPSLDSRRLHTRTTSKFEQGYQSQPETLLSSSFAPQIVPMRKERSALVPSVVPAASVSSSYVDIPTPSQSTCEQSSSQEAYRSALPALPQQSTEWKQPTASQLTRAASLPLIAPSGLRIPFGSVFSRVRTVVIFLRHFWCPWCQDYMASLASLAPKDANIVIVSNGSHALIDKYKQIFGINFDMYVDPSMDVYRALGMDLKGLHHAVEAKTNERTGYVRRGAIRGIAMVVLRALRVGMPVWEKGGDIGQLGGEFVLGPGMKCSWAHRMQTPRGHAPVATVLAGAGIGLEPVSTPRVTRRESMAEVTTVKWTVEDRRKSMCPMTVEQETRWSQSSTPGQSTSLVVDEDSSAEDITENRVVSSE